MVLAFKPQFKAPILAGTKIHTIRLDPNRRWKLGVTAHMATGVRTKNYDCFKTDVCTGTQSIEIIRTSEHINDTSVKVDGRMLTTKEIQQLAWNDGFPNLIAFHLWFNQDYSGVIIHWTDKRY